MRLAIADPPYLGRAARWYGAGRGHSAGRGRADNHVDAHAWDVAARHIDLVRELDATYDGWAIALTPDSLPLYLAHAPEGVRTVMWQRGNAIPNGSRIRGVWEPALVSVPAARRRHGTGPAVDDVLVAAITPGGFAGRKPEAWTHWILALLGYDPAADDVDDLFPGSGSVTEAVDTYRPARPKGQGRMKRAPEVQSQQLRRTARSGRGRKAAVIAALRAGGSIRAVADDARVAPSTVQRWKKEAEHYD